jgi:hypothetical protein
LLNIGQIPVMPLLKSCEFSGAAAPGPFVRAAATGIVECDVARFAGFAFVCLASCVACGGTPKPDAPPPPSGGDPISITGTESIGWDQQATSEEAAGFRYLIYVDGSPTALTDVQCSASGAILGCRSRLPPLTAGVHRLELTAASLFNGQYFESPMSPAVMVLVTARVTAPAASLPSNAPRPSGASDIPAAGCTALAIGGPASEVIVADAAGIRRVQSGVDSGGTVLLQPDPAAPPVLSLAVHPAFAVTRFVYTLNDSGSDDRGHRLQLVRYREVGGTLGERAVLLERAVDGRYRFGRLRFDGAGRLYAGAWGLAQQASLLLRLTEEGRVGDDSPDRSGLVPGAESMRGFDVEPATGRLWILQEVADRVFALRTLTVDGRATLEPLPLTGAPAQIAVRADAVGAAVSQLWAAFSEGPPVLLRPNARGALAVAPLPALVDGPIGDLAFAQSGVLLACTSPDPAPRGSGSRVVRLDRALGRGAVLR